MYTVYKHTCPNGKVYIGITSQSVERRWRGNGYGYFKQRYFYNAILKYGWDNIKHEIIDIGLTKEEAEQKEIELITEYKSFNWNYGYNQTEGGDHRTGHPHTEESKKKLAEAQSGKKLSEETKNKISIAHLGKKGELSKLSKRVVQIDKEGKTIAIYAGISEAERMTGIPCTNIVKVCKGERQFASGYKWEYAAANNLDMEG